MSWELQPGMGHLIRPSVDAYLASHESPEAEAARILCYQRTEGETHIPTINRAQRNCDADVERLGLGWAAAAISEHAETVATTSSGAWNVYLDSGGWCEVPFVESADA